MSERVFLQVAGGIMTATLNRADKRNAIDSAMIDGLCAAPAGTSARGCI